MSQDRILESVKRFADLILDKGRYLYGNQENPLIADGIDLVNGGGARIDVAAEVVDGAVLSNPACQQRLLRTLVGLSRLTGDETYGNAAESVMKYMFDVLSDKNGLFYWGGHVAFDLEHNKIVTGKSGPHELKCHYPFYDLMWDINPEGTKRYIEAFWNAHIYNWQVLDFSRHGKYDLEMGDLWNHRYHPGRIFFVGRGLTFINCGSDLYYAAGMLHGLGGEIMPLTWAQRLNGRYLETRDPNTGMGGYQFTLRHLPGAQYWSDRAIHQFGNQLAGHFIAEGAISHPRQIQAICGLAGLARMALSDRLGDIGWNFAQTAIEDLIAYGKWAYEPSDNTLHATHTDGTRLTGLVFEQDGYYGKAGRTWEPVRAGGLMLRAYATAYRLSLDRVERAFLWQMIRDIARGNGLGDFDGQANLITDCADADTIHALIELYACTQLDVFLDLAERVVHNIMGSRFREGYFVSGDRALVDDPAPLALLRFFAARENVWDQVPNPIR
jgi:pectate lyase